MVILLAALLVGLMIGLVRGGRIRHLARLRPRWTPVLVVGLIGLLLASFGPLDAPELVLATSLVACLVFCLANLRLRGLGVVAVGLAANLAPILANGAMPVDADALVHADAGSEVDGGREMADDDTMLLFLGDVIPIPELHLVVSFGDLIVAAGLGAFARNAVRHRRTRGVPASEILAADDRARESGPGDDAGRPGDDVIDLTRMGSGRRRQHPVEVSPGEPVPIPMGWGPECDDDLVGAGIGHDARGDGAVDASPHVPWPWRRTPPPRPGSHPTMRVTRH